MRTIDPTPRTQRARRTLTAAGLAGAAALVLAACGSTDTTATATDDGVGTPSTSPATQAPTALELPDGGGPAAACAELTPEGLATADTAFAATVTTVNDEVVVLAVDTVYAGDPGASVTVPRPDNGLPSELSMGALTEGGTFLISTQGDLVLTCGQSGPATPELQALYDAAY